MNTSTLKKYLTFILFIVVALGLTIGAHYLLKPIKEKNQGSYGELVNVNKGSVLTEQPYTKAGKKFMEYTVSGVGAYVGNSEGEVITKLLIDSDNIITQTSFTKYDHTVGVYDVPSYKFIESLVKNKVNILTFTDDFPVDENSGASKGDSPSNSVRIIRSSIYGLTLYLKGEEPVVPVEKSAYEKLFGKDYELINETKLIDGEINRDGSIITRYDVVVDSKLVAYTYFVTRDGLKITGETHGDEPYGSIEIQVITDTFTTRILGTEIDKENYHHSSTDNYMNITKNYLSKLVENTIYAASYEKSDIIVDGDSGASSNDEVGGTTNTIKLVQQILEDLATHLQNDYQFGTLEKIEGEAETRVLSKQTLTISGTSYTIYQTRGFGEYFEYDPANEIVTELVIDSSDIIKYTSFIKYTHSQYDGYDIPSHKFINSLVTKNVDIKGFKADYPVDENSGASNGTNPSNSVRVIIASIVKVADYINGNTSEPEPEPIVIPNYFEKLFGELGVDYTLANEVKLVDGEVNLDGAIITRKDIVVGGKTVAYAYYVERSGSYINDGEYGGPLDASFEIQIITDLYTTQVIGSNIDLEKYNHSDSGAITVSNYLELLIKGNVNLIEYEVSGIIIDEESGATKPGTVGNSVKLAQNMLVDLKTKLKETVIATPKNEFDFVDEDSMVLSSQTFNVGLDSYKVYEVMGNGVYYTNNEGKESIGHVITKVVVDKNGIIVDTRFVDYKHTQSARFKAPSDKFIASLVRNEVNIKDFTIVDYPIDSDSGATASGPSNSVKIIRASIARLAEFLNGGTR